MLDFPGTRDARMLSEAAGRMNGIGASPKGAFRKAVPQDLKQNLHYESCGLIKFSLQLLHCRKPLAIPRRLDVCLHGYVARAAIVVRRRSRKNAFENVAGPKKGVPPEIPDLHKQDLHKQKAPPSVMAALWSCPGPASMLPGATICYRPIRSR